MHKKLQTEIFGIFECLITPKPTNQDSQLSWFFQVIWKTVRKSRNIGLQGIIFARKRFQNLLHGKLQAEKWNLWFLEFYFYVKCISNKGDIWPKETLPWVLEKRKLNISK